ncbi:hypothetical protein Hanom_Chr14g01275931 [Helianthus anomalus]
MVSPNAFGGRLPSISTDPLARATGPPKWKRENPVLSFSFRVLSTFSSLSFSSFFSTFCRPGTLAWS